MDFFTFLKKNPYVFSYDIRFNSKRKDLMLKVSQIPLTLTRNGLPRIILLSLIPAPAKEKSAPVLYRLYDNLYFSYSLSNNQWEMMNVPFVTNNEFKVVLLSAQGYTEVEIAEQMCKSHDSIRSYKRSIYQKLGVKNIIVAIPFLMYNKWLTICDDNN